MAGSWSGANGQDWPMAGSEGRAAVSYYCFECETTKEDWTNCNQRGHTLCKISESPTPGLDPNVPDFDVLSANSGFTANESSQRTGSSFDYIADDTLNSFTSESNTESWIDSRALVLGSNSDPTSLQPACLTDPQDIEMRHVDPFEDINADQKETLLLFSRRCDRDQRAPTVEDVRAIRNLEPGLDELLIFHWLQQNVTLNNGARQAILPNDFTPSSTAFSSSGEASTDIQEAVASYALFRNLRPCRSTKASSRNGRFKCTTGCRYSTNDDDTWRRHVQTKYPMEFWLCTLCKDAGRKTFICHRKNHMQAHLKSQIHQADREQGLNIPATRDDCQVDYPADYPVTCPFTTLPCFETFSSMREYMDHCLNHFRDGDHLPPNSGGDDDDDDDDDDGNNDGGDSNAGDGTGPNGSSGSSQFGPFLTPGSGKAAGKKGPLSYGHSMMYTSSGSSGQLESRCDSDWTFAENDHTSSLLDKASCSGCELTSDESGAWPSLLVDVETQTLVRKTRKVKYLALDYSWSSQHEPNSSTVSITCSDATQISRRDLPHLPATFAKAIGLTKDMGYQYLWIDILCEKSISERRRQDLFYRATLTIVIVSSVSSPEHIWHFACHYSKVKTIHSWEAADVPELSHIQNLGHGTYGIVDKVRLASTKEVFARKMLLSSANKSERHPSQLQEIETLQRLDHPNIPKFVAAYYQENSLNILMQPVADCDLKHFLADPSRWEDKLLHIPQWYFDLASALEYLHSLSVRHRDIKPANILIDGSHIFLADFGTAQEFVDISLSCGGALMTPKYCAPEVASRGCRGRKSDIFSLGCVFLELVTVDLKVPLLNLELRIAAKNRGKNQEREYHNNLGLVKAWLQDLRPCAVNLYQITILELCVKMLHYNPANRPSAQEVCQALSASPRGALNRDGQNSLGLALGMNDQDVRNFEGDISALSTGPTIKASKSEIGKGPSRCPLKCLDFRHLYGSGGMDSWWLLWMLGHCCLDLAHVGALLLHVVLPYVPSLLTETLLTPCKPQWDLLRSPFSSQSTCYRRSPTLLVWNTELDQLESGNMSLSDESQESCRRGVFERFVARMSTILSCVAVVVPSEGNTGWTLVRLTLAIRCSE